MLNSELVRDKINKLKSNNEHLYNSWQEFRKDNTTSSNNNRNYYNTNAYNNNYTNNYTNTYADTNAMANTYANTNNNTSANTYGDNYQEGENEEYITNTNQHNYNKSIYRNQENNYTPTQKRSNTPCRVSNSYNKLNNSEFEEKVEREEMVENRKNPLNNMETIGQRLRDLEQEVFNPSII